MSKAFPEKYTVYLTGIYFSKTCTYRWASAVPSQMCKLPVIQCTLMHPYTITDTGYWKCMLTTTWLAPFIFSPKKQINFKNEFKIFTWQTTGEFCTLPQSIFRARAITFSSQTMFWKCSLAYVMMSLQNNVCLHTVQSEGPKIMAIQYWFSATCFVYKDFFRFCESFK